MDRCQECGSFVVHKVGCSQREEFAEAAPPRTYRDGYRDGLRRAQELARQMLPSGDCFARELDQAIDAEVAKEGK